MYGNYKLEDVYGDFLVNYKQVYLNKYITFKNSSMGGTSSFQHYGYVNGKFQYLNGILGLSSHISYYLNVNSSVSVPIYTGVIYYSPKYERYQSVFLKAFRLTYDDE